MKAYSLPLLVLIVSACQGHKDQHRANPQPTPTVTPLPDGINWMQLALLEGFDLSDRVLTSTENQSFDKEGKLLFKTNQNYNAQGSVTASSSEGESPTQSTYTYDTQGHLLSSHSTGTYTTMQYTTDVTKTYDADGFELTSDSTFVTSIIETSAEIERSTSHDTLAYDNQHRVQERLHVGESKRSDYPTFDRMKQTFQYGNAELIITGEGCYEKSAADCDDSSKTRKKESKATFNGQGQLLHILTNDVSGAEPKALTETKVDWTQSNFSVINFDDDDDDREPPQRPESNYVLQNIDHLQARSPEFVQSCFRGHSPVNAGYCFVEITSDVWDDFLFGARPLAVLSDPFLRDMLQAQSYRLFGEHDTLKDIEMTRNCDINEENHRHCHTVEKLTEKGSPDRLVDHDFDLKKVESGWELRYETESDLIHETSVVQYDKDKRYLSSREESLGKTANDEAKTTVCAFGYDKSRTKRVWEACEVNKKASSLIIYNY